jgi:hypothetical protein
MEYEHDMKAFFWTDKSRSGGWLQYHLAQAVVDYANAHPELGIGSISALHHQTRHRSDPSQ